MNKFPFFVSAICLGLVAGCLWVGKSSERHLNFDPKERTFINAQSISADKLPYTNARLILAGTEVPVTLKRIQSGSRVLFEIVAKSEVLEEEIYLSDDKAFRFASLTGETFEPAIPLIRYPMTVGESWDWSGSAGLGPTVKPATARITSSMEKLNLVTGVAECVRVTAELEVKTGQSGISKRPLKFWIEPGKGIVKREFAYSSTREPRSVTTTEP